MRQIYVTSTDLIDREHHKSQVTTDGNRKFTTTTTIKSLLLLHSQHSVYVYKNTFFFLWEKTKDIIYLFTVISISLL